jgi:mannose-6-phosphate isomerase-like protein (cupin superfamily)
MPRVERIGNARAINLSAECRAVPGMTGRTSQTASAELEAKCFGPTFPYRDGFISTVKFSGTSSWERHSGEELLLVAEGSGFLLLIDDDGFVVPRSLSENLLIVVPSGAWHQVKSETGITLITITPQPTDHQAERP